MSNPELQALLEHAIGLLAGELELLEPGQRADLIKVLTELRHQIAALLSFQKTQRAQAALESAVLATIKEVDEGVWREILTRLEKQAA